MEHSDYSSNTLEDITTMSEDVEPLMNQDSEQLSIESDLSPGVTFSKGEVPSGEVPPPVSWRAEGFVYLAGGENRLVIPLHLENLLAGGLVDTGASFSMVGLGWLHQNGLVLRHQYSQTCYGFGVGGAVRVVGEVTLKIRISGLKLLPLVCQVIDTELPSEITVILAVDFLTSNSLTVDVKRKMIRQQLPLGAAVDYYNGTKEGSSEIFLRRLPCFAIGTITIPVNETIRIPVTWRSRDSPDYTAPDCVQSDILFFEGSSQVDKVNIYPGLISSRGDLFVVASSTERSARIKEGDIVGTVSSIITLDSTPTRDAADISSVLMVNEPADTSGAVDIDIMLPSTLNLTPSERCQAFRMLQSQDTVFSVSDNNIGKMGVVEHRIELWDDTPIYQRPRRLPGPISQEIEAQCKELELLDIIEPSSSSWSSPVVPVRKKDGNIRLCVDYRRLNAVTKPDRFPLPNLTDAVFGLYGVKFFTSLDLVRGYYQLPLEENSRELTAFSTPHNHWQFKRLSFGLKNAPAAFQREMQHVLSGFSWRKVVVYIDDVLIMSETYAEHLDLVRRVLTTLDAHGIKVKLSKCTWFAEEVEYLGHSRTQWHQEMPQLCSED